MRTSIIKKIKLGNTVQYLIIRGEEEKPKPIMLFLHGGPGIPELFTMKKEMGYLEEQFVVIYWEQRGAGKSYKVKGLTLEQIVLDTLELSRWLIENYSQERIYLMGHSWGSFLGLLVVQQSPELYHAYIGIGQVTHQYEAEKISLEWIEKEAKRRNDKRAMKKLSKLKIPLVDAPIKEWIRFLNIHRGYIFKYGGTVRETKGIFWKWMKQFFLMSEYSFKEKIFFLPSSFYSMKQLWHDVVRINLFERIKRVEVPVYIFQGTQDYQASYLLSKKFLEQLDAPKKELFTFENSAHSPHIEENKKFNKLLKIILEKKDDDKPHSKRKIHSHTKNSLYL